MRWRPRLTHSHEAALAVLTLVLAVACSEERAADSDADIIPPAAIADLRAVNTTDETIELLWTASGDDSLTGFCPAYEIGYAVDSITESSWPAAHKIAVQILTAEASDEVSAVALNLAPATKYYFAIKGIDEAGNVSGLSNVVTAQTRPLEIAADEFPFAPGTEWQFELTEIFHFEDSVSCIDTLTVSILSVSPGVFGEQAGTWSVEYLKCPPVPYRNMDNSTVSLYDDSCIFVSDRYGDFYNPPIVRRLLLPLRTGLTWSVPSHPLGVFSDMNVVSDGGVVRLEGIGIDSVHTLQLHYYCFVFNDYITRDYWFAPEIGLVKMEEIRSLGGGILRSWRLIGFHTPGM